MSQVAVPRVRITVVMVAMLVFGPLAAPATAVCAAFSPQGSFKRAEVVVVGVAIDGPAAPDGSLTSPAAFDVLEYRKGSGPSQVRVETGTTAGGRKGSYTVSSVGIGPRAGETWQLFGELRGGVLRTSTCAGSRPLRSTLADTGPPASSAAFAAFGLLLLGGSLLRRRAGGVGCAGGISD